MPLFYKTITCVQTKHDLFYQGVNYFGMSTLQSQQIRFDKNITVLGRTRAPWKKGTFYRMVLAIDYSWWFGVTILCM